MNETERRLRNHAKIIKEHMQAPSAFSREELKMNEKRNFKKVLICVAAAVCILFATAFAAVHMLNAKEAASALGDEALAKYFDECGSPTETVTDGAYRATVLGLVSGKNLSELEQSSREVLPERTYAVVAVEKADGTAMTYDDEILVTPLIRGLKPWQYNIFTMNGGYTANIINGVLYRIIEFDSIEYFADRDVYMAVLSGDFLNNDSYAFDEATGEISPKDDFDGTNILIKLKLDKSKADPEKAQKYLDELNKTAETSDVESEDEEYDTSTESENEIKIYDSGYKVETSEEDGTISLTVSQK